MAFFGKDERTIDSKGRLSLPAKHRKNLPDEVLILPIFNEEYGKALYVFSQEALEAWVKRFYQQRSGDEGGGYDQCDDADRNLDRYIHNNSEPVLIDSVGRVKLTSLQCKMVGIDKDVLVSGNNDHLEIWDVQTYIDFWKSRDPFTQFTSSGRASTTQSPRSTESGDVQ